MPGIDAAILVQHKGQRQPGHVGRVDDRQIEPARDDRHQHGQRQQAKFRQLERDRAKVGPGQELGRSQAEDHQHQRQKAQQARHLGAEGGNGTAVKRGHSRPSLAGSNHLAGSRFEVEIASRMMMPTTILKA